MIDIPALKKHLPSTPAFIVDKRAIITALDSLASLRDRCGCRVLYSIKALPLTEVLSIALPYVDGFSVSSLFEARLAREVLANRGSIHLCTPGVRPDEIPELARLCSHVSCNSLGQFERFEALGPSQASIGVRVNPQLSFTDDERYDPCRPFSKLGVELPALLDSEALTRMQGLHFHTVFGKQNYAPLLQTLSKIQTGMDTMLSSFTWINLGGGYLYDQIDDNDAFCRTVTGIRQESGAAVFIEPGNAVTGKAGYLATSIIDCFQSGGKTIAVLDTSINHLPEVFEYQRQPALAEHDPEGDYQVVLAGSTCLAGDLFGEFRFRRPPAIGDRLVFTQAGAYTLVKANRFNGYNLPDIYVTDGEDLRELKRYGYEEYRQQWSGETG